MATRTGDVWIKHLIQTPRLYLVYNLTEYTQRLKKRTITRLKIDRYECKHYFWRIYNDINIDKDEFMTSLCKSRRVFDMYHIPEMFIYRIIEHSKPIPNYGQTYRDMIGDTYVAHSFPNESIRDGDCTVLKWEISNQIENEKNISNSKNFFLMIQGS